MCELFQKHVNVHLTTSFPQPMNVRIRFAKMMKTSQKSFCWKYQLSLLYQPSTMQHWNQVTSCNVVWARPLCFCSRPSPACWAFSLCKKCELMSIGTTGWLISLSNIQLLCLKVKTKKQTSLDFYWFHQVLVLSFNTNTKISDRFAEAFHLRWHPWPQ